MSSIAWQLIAESRIQEAFERGEFDHLPGTGKPFDLSDYFATPVADRVKSAGALPPELVLLKEAEALDQALSTCRDEAKRARIQQEIQARRTGFALAQERRARSARADGSLEPPAV